ncbi:hypothetical protein ACHMW7_19835 [Aminobacter sp. UC22_36]
MVEKLGGKAEVMISEEEANADVLSLRWGVIELSRYFFASQ